MPGTDYKENNLEDEVLFSQQEAVAIVQVIALALGKEGGLSLEPVQSRAISRVLDEAAVALIPVSKS